MTESYIHSSPAGTSYVGPDAVSYFRAKAIRSALRLYLRTDGAIRPTRGWTLTLGLASAKPYTGQTYKRTRADAQRCISDLDVWIATMASALPITESI